MYYFLKIGSNKNVSNFVVYIIKFIWFNPGDTVLYPGVNSGTPVLSKGLIYLYKNNTFFLIGIHSMQGWTTSTKHGVTREEAQKDYRIQKICLERTYN